MRVSVAVVAVFDSEAVAVPLLLAEEDVRVFVSDNEDVLSVLLDVFVVKVAVALDEVFVSVREAEREVVADLLVLERVMLVEVLVVRKVRAPRGVLEADLLVVGVVVGVFVRVLDLEDVVLVCLGFSEGKGEAFSQDCFVSSPPNWVSFCSKSHLSPSCRRQSSTLCQDIRIRAHDARTRNGEQHLGSRCRAGEKLQRAFTIQADHLDHRRRLDMRLQPCHAFTSQPHVASGFERHVERWAADGRKRFGQHFPPRRRDSVDILQESWVAVTPNKREFAVGAPEVHCFGVFLRRRFHVAELFSRKGQVGHADGPLL